ncbi:MAG: hypothetical protein ACRDKW_05800, partial [Actinomycetota bacterium]
MASSFRALRWWMAVYGPDGGIVHRGRGLLPHPSPVVRGYATSESSTTSSTAEGPPQRGADLRRCAHLLAPGSQALGHEVVARAAGQLRHEVVAEQLPHHGPL